MYFPIQGGLFVDDRVIGFIRQNIIAICRAYPEAVSSDALLLARYWLEVDGLSELIDKESYCRWMRTKATPAESITRGRRACREQLNTNLSIERQRQEIAKNHRAYWAQRA